MSTPAIAPQGPLARALERRREHYNLQFARARHSHRQLEADSFAYYLADMGEELLAWAEGAGEETIDALTAAFYDIALEGVGTRLLGPSSRLPIIDTALRSLLFGPNPLLLARPRWVLASLINGLHSLATTPGGRPEQWVVLMQASLRAALAADPSPSRGAQLWLESGQVAAWRAGLACYRDGALALVRSLPEEVARAALGLEARGGVAAGVLLDRLAADPWLLPGHADAQVLPPRQLRLVRRVGDFVGFGGVFGRPPGLVSYQGRIYVTDGPPQEASSVAAEVPPPACWLLSADACGATLTPSALPPAPWAASAFSGAPNLPGAAALSLAPDGTVATSGQRACLDELRGARSCAATSHTLAVSVPSSYRILLVASAP
jgi:hypothetical protein